MPESGPAAQQEAVPGQEAAPERQAGPRGVDAAKVAREAAARLGPADADAFLARLEQLSFDITGPLSQLYGDIVDTHGFATELVLDALEAAASRPAGLRRLDRRREIDPAWFQRSRIIGYVCYADRFAGSLQGVREHLDYLV